MQLKKTMTTGVMLWLLWTNLLIFSYFLLGAYDAELFSLLIGCP